MILKGFWGVFGLQLSNSRFNYNLLFKISLVCDKINGMKKFKKIYIEITNICNLNCSFCSKDNKEKREMTLIEFEHILKQIDNYTDYLYLHVKGEPLLHSEIEEIINLCKKYHKYINITTNGTLLKQKLNILENVRQINISLHSLIDKNKLIDILKCGDYLSEKNVQVVYRFWTNNNRDLIKNILDYYNYKDELSNNMKLKDNLYLNKSFEFVWPSLNNPFISNIGYCQGMNSHIGILVDGTIIPCCLDSSGIINLGNIYEEDLKDILNKEKTKQVINGFKNNKLVEELCQKCDFRKKVFK